MEDHNQIPNDPMGAIAEEKIYYKIDLNISQENISIMDMNGETKSQTQVSKKKKIKKIKKKMKLPNNNKKIQVNLYADRGYDMPVMKEQEPDTQVALEFFEKADVLWFPTKMSKKDKKAPDKQTLPNGRAMDGYIKRENKKGIEGYWATPNDFKIYTKEQIKERQTDKNLADSKDPLGQQAHASGQPVAEPLLGSR